MQNYLTSREIMHAVGISGVNTLTRYHKSGLIPPPERRTHPSGRGTTSYWEEWVVHRCQRIQEQSRLGKTREQIREFLGDDWDAARLEYERLGQRQEADATLTKRLDRRRSLELLNLAVVEQLGPGLPYGTKPGSSNNTDILPDDVIEECLGLIREGLQPIFVVVGENSYLTDTVSLGLHLPNLGRLDTSFTVVPLLPKLRAILGNITNELATASISLTKEVTETTDTETFRRQVMLLDELRTQLGPREALATKQASVSAGRRKEPSKYQSRVTEGLMRGGRPSRLTHDPKSQPRRAKILV